MRILAVDTATRTCSVALTEAAEPVVELFYSGSRTHARHLMQMIDAVMRLAESSLADLAAVAVTRGPGSFTGLRIGLSTVKGLAAASGKPVVAVSTLEALAFQADDWRGLICPLIDARRNEVYYSRYRLKDGRLSPVFPESVGSPDKAIKGISEPVMLIGSGARLYRDFFAEKMGDAACFAPHNRHAIQGASVAALALQRLEVGDRDHLESLVPRYIRKSDAELKAGAAAKQPYFQHH